MIKHHHHKTMKWMILVVLAGIFLWSCKDDSVDPPVITVTVNGEVVARDKDSVLVENETFVEYIFLISASTTIQEVYTVNYTAKYIKNPDNLTEEILTEPEGNMSYPVGLTKSLKEEVKGNIFFKAPELEKYGLTGLMIVVSDVSGNESRRTFYLNSK